MAPPSNQAHFGARRIRNKGSGWMSQAFAVSILILIGRSKSLNDLLTEDRCDLTQLLNEFAELRRCELLWAV